MFRYAVFFCAMLALVATAAAQEPAEPTMIKPILRFSSLAKFITFARTSNQFSTFAAAVEAMNLTSTLTSAGPITILSPTNKGFETRLKALNITVDKVLANPQLLTTVLKFHVLPGGAYLSKQFRNNQNVTTLLGPVTPLTVNLRGKRIKPTITFKGPFNNASVVIADIKAGKAMLQAIDDVLMPPLPLSG